MDTISFSTVRIVVGGSTSGLLVVDLDHKLLLGLNKFQRGMIWSTLPCLREDLSVLDCQNFHLYHPLLNTAPPLTHDVFLRVQSDVVKAAEFVAIPSMEYARNDLIEIHQPEQSDAYVSTVASFDGAYQMQSGKCGGGFSRFCFGAAISLDIVMVVA